MSVPVHRDGHRPAESPVPLSMRVNACIGPGGLSDVRIAARETDWGSDTTVALLVSCSLALACY